LHPRYYGAGAGLAERDFVLVDPMDFNRLTFYLIGPRPLSVILPLEFESVELTNAADVLVLVCAANPELSVAVVVKSSQPGLISNPNSLSYCARESLTQNGRSP
jgi:hypothetical protein